MLLQLINNSFSVQKIFFLKKNWVYKSKVGCNQVVIRQVVSLETTTADMTSTTEPNISLDPWRNASPSCDEHTAPRILGEVGSKVTGMAKLLGRQTECLEKMIEVKRLQVQQQNKEWLGMAFLVICAFSLMMAQMTYLALINDNLTKASQNLEVLTHHSLHFFNDMKNRIQTGD